MAEVKEVPAMGSLTDQTGPGAGEDLTFDELARRQGVGPVSSLAELAQPDLWESDEEYADFLSDLYASRRAGAA
jgi:hypothetical protein